MTEWVEVSPQWDLSNNSSHCKVKIIHANIIRESYASNLSTNTWHIQASLTGWILWKPKNNWLHFSFVWMLSYSSGSMSRMSLCWLAALTAPAFILWIYVDLSENYPSLSQPGHRVSVSKIANRCSSIFSVLISQPLFFYVLAGPKFNLNQMPQFFASLCWS